MLHERAARALAGDPALAAEVAGHWRAAGRPAEELPARIAAAEAAERVLSYEAHYNGRRPIAADSSTSPVPTTRSPTSPRSRSSVGPSSAASSANTNGQHRSPGQRHWPSSGTPQAPQPFPGSTAVPPGPPGGTAVRRADGEDSTRTYTFG